MPIQPKSREEFDRWLESEAKVLKQQIEIDARTHIVGIGQELATNMNQSLNGQRDFSTYFVFGDSTHDIMHEAFLLLANLPKVEIDEPLSATPWVFDFEGYSQVVLRTIERDDITKQAHGVTYTVLPAVELAAIAA